MSALDRNNIMCTKIGKELVGLHVMTSPTSPANYEQNYSDFIQEIDRLDLQVKQIFVDWKDCRFLVFFPSWGDFAQAHGSVV